MLFHSHEFLFVFLPVTVLVFWWLGQYGRRLALGWLALASLGFYGWWYPPNLILLIGSMLCNYALGRRMERLGERPGARRFLLGVGVVANLALIGYFKYAGFLVTNLDHLVGAGWTVPNIILPLGISFFTFQQIAYLVDTSRGESQADSFLDYCLFVTFFPQLIAGPIVHPKEMLPQF